jgi:hypothetical protein
MCAEQNIFIQQQEVNKAEVFQMDLLLKAVKRWPHILICKNT